MKNYDLIVLGSGSAGNQAAHKAKGAGWNVAVINDGPFGGTCAVRGCIPKKVLAGTAEVADTAHRLRELGIFTDEPQLDWQKTIAFKRSFTDPFPDNVKNSLIDAGIDIYEGAPHFTGDRQLEVNGEEVSADKVYIAVGAKPAKLPFDGNELMLTSDDFLELDTLPKRIVFVGGGYVSFELAHIAARFGSEVTILHIDDRPLPMFDADIIKTLLRASEAAGIRVALEAGAERVIQKDDGSFTVTDNNGTEYTADAVVNGAGRPPAIADLNLEATHVEHDLRRGVRVNEYLQSTSNPNVYAAGDAADAGPPLSPVAGVQGGIVGDNLLGEKRAQPSYHSTPSIIFTTPSAGKAGYLEEEAAEQGIDFDVRTNDISGWFDSKRLNQPHAMSKILVESTTNKIIGAHIIGDHAAGSINLLALAIEHGMTVEQLKTPILAFPTATDDIRSML